MILFSLGNSEDIALGCGGKRVRNPIHMRKRLMVESKKPNKKHDIWRTYSRGMARVHVNGGGYMHR